jgi:hypothetical protein
MERGNALELSGKELLTRPKKCDSRLNIRNSLEQAMPVGSCFPFNKLFSLFQLLLRHVKSGAALGGFLT